MDCPSFSGGLGAWRSNRRRNVSSRPLPRVRGMGGRAGELGARAIGQWVGSGCNAQHRLSGRRRLGRCRRRQGRRGIGRGRNAQHRLARAARLGCRNVARAARWNRSRNLHLRVGWWFGGRDHRGSRGARSWFWRSREERTQMGRGETHPTGRAHRVPGYVSGPAGRARDHQGGHYTLCPSRSECPLHPLAAGGSRHRRSFGGRHRRIPSGLCPRLAASGMGVGGGE